MGIFFLFKNTRAVIKAESLCQVHEIRVEVVPVPEKVSSECGMALKTHSENQQTLCALLEQNQIAFSLYEE
ncbi:MAG: putative Se/S carrier-like protein [Bacteroidales bacterium]